MQHYHPHSGDRKMAIDYSILALQRLVLLNLSERRLLNMAKPIGPTTVAIYLDFARIGRTIGKFIIDFNVKMNIIARRRGPIWRSNLSTIGEALRLATELIWVKLPKPACL